MYSGNVIKQEGAIPSRLFTTNKNFWHFKMSMHLIAPTANEAKLYCTIFFIVTKVDISENLMEADKTWAA